MAFTTIVVKCSLFVVVIIIKR